MPKHKHIPQYITPSKKDVLPLGEEKCWRFVGLGFALNHILDYVACAECGMIGHAIKSRRGGFRWHTSAGPEEIRRIFSDASKFYDELGLEKPQALNKLGQLV